MNSKINYLYEKIIFEIRNIKHLNENWKNYIINELIYMQVKISFLKLYNEKI
jgi:hypothetical protein